MYSPCSENKGADQWRSYCTADLRLCFRIGNHPVFSLEAAHYNYYTTQSFIGFLNQNERVNERSGQGRQQ